MTTDTTPLETPPHHQVEDRLDVLVIGAGQAGLALAWHLRRQGLRFLLVDAAPALGHSWRNRWDSLRLFSPAQYDGLPGMPFPARADTYPSKDEVADYLAAYAAAFDLPVLLGTAVTRLEQGEAGFVAHTRHGVLRAQQVVVATGAFQRPEVPALAAGLSPRVQQLHSSDYRTPGTVPGSRVVVVGAGNSGVQIAGDLATTHQVTLAVGTRAPRLPQRFLGRDLFWWLSVIGIVSRSSESPLVRRMRARGDLLIGPGIEPLARRGVRIRARLVATDSDTVSFADGTTTKVDTIVWATGFRPDYAWIDVPGALHEGAPVHREGLSPVPGLSFLGLPWQRSRGSSLLGFVQHDAAWLSRHILTNHHPAHREEAR
jgi:putative flavoprotein involved in K+ transport